MMPGMQPFDAPLRVFVTMQTLERAEGDPADPFQVCARHCTRRVGHLDVPAGAVLQRLIMHVNGDPHPILSIPLSMAEAWPDDDDDQVDGADPFEVVRRIRLRPEGDRPRRDWFGCWRWRRGGRR